MSAGMNSPLAMPPFPGASDHGCTGTSRLGNDEEGRCNFAPAFFIVSVIVGGSPRSLLRLLSGWRCRISGLRWQRFFGVAAIWWNRRSRLGSANHPQCNHHPDHDHDCGADHRHCFTLISHSGPHLNSFFKRRLVEEVPDLRTAISEQRRAGQGPLPILHSHPCVGTIRRGRDYGHVE